MEREVVGLGEAVVLLIGAFRRHFSWQIAGLDIMTKKKRLTYDSFVVLRILSLSLVSLGKTSENRGRSVGVPLNMYFAFPILDG